MCKQIISTYQRFSKFFVIVGHIRNKRNIKASISNRCRFFEIVQHTFHLCIEHAIRLSEAFLQVQNNNNITSCSADNEISTSVAVLLRS